MPVAIKAEKKFDGFNKFSLSKFLALIPDNSQFPVTPELVQFTSHLHYNNSQHGGQTSDDPSYLRITLRSNSIEVSYVDLK